MAGVVHCNRDLWQLITGSSPKPQNLVGDEIKKNKTRLTKGLDFYTSPKTPSGDKLKKERKVQSPELEFIQKLSCYLHVDEIQCHDLYVLYINREYRGSRKQLQETLEKEKHTASVLSKHSHSLLARIRDCYFTERLYLLRCLKHLLSNWQEAKHPYRKVYAGLVEELGCKLPEALLEQYDTVCSWELPVQHTRPNNEVVVQAWLHQNLKEQCELLELLVLHYRTAQHSQGALHQLALKFKKQGFGHRQTNRHLLNDGAQPLLQRIGFLQMILLIEGMDLEDLMARSAKDSIEQHHIVASKEFKEFDSYFLGLGDSAEHGPLMLLWVMMKQQCGGGESATVRKLGARAADMHPFQYIATQLKSDPFSGKAMLPQVCHNVIYGLLSSLLLVFDENTLGDRQGLHDVATCLLKRSFLADDFWEKGLEAGLGTLVDGACATYPLEAAPLMQLCAALASANDRSAHQVVCMLQRLSHFTEIMDQNTEVKATHTRLIWQLDRDRQPYQFPGVCVRIPAGSSGQLLQQTDSLSVMRWSCDYDGWEVIQAELCTLLQQVSHGAGTVQPDMTRRATAVCELTHAVLMSSPQWVVDNVPQLNRLVDLILEVIARFSQVASVPLDLVAVCLRVLSRCPDSLQVWAKLQRTGLLPFLTENIDNFAEVSSTSGLNTGAYGSILAGTECVAGRYPVTLALLDFISALVQPLCQSGEGDSLLAVVLFVTRDIFPAFQKWRFLQPTEREQIGQKCLETFHQVLNVKDPNKDPSAKVSLRDACVYSLLFTESGQSLLAIVSTSVDVVDAALASQGSASEGHGVELILLLRMAYSVLNRLLLLRPHAAPPSPVEHCLSAQPATTRGRHVVATIAQYIYHNHDHRLPVLATVLLRKLAMMFPMSLLACLGEEAEAIRDVYLSRLHTDSEDVRLKVVILELLATCVATQPGLIEIFLNVQTNDRPNNNNNTDNSGLSLGKVSCLQTLLSLIEDHKQSTYECPSQLLCAAVEFVHALWYGRRETAMAVLRQKRGFWHSVCLSLTRDLQKPFDTDVDLQVLAKEVKSCANIMKVLALELYSCDRNKLDKNLQNVLQDILSKNRIRYWSKYLSECMEWSSQLGTVAMETVHDHCTVQLLLAWRNFMLVLATGKDSHIVAPDCCKTSVLADLLAGIQAQFRSGQELGVLQTKLASTASAAYLTLLKHYIKHVTDVNRTLCQLEAVLTQTCAACETLIPTVQIGLLASLSLLLQHTASSSLTDVDPDRLESLITVVCSILQQSTYQLPSPRQHPPPAPEPMDTPTPAQAPPAAAAGKVDGHNTRELDLKLKLQTISICLLEELISYHDDVDGWLSTVRRHSTVQCLVSSVQLWMEAQRGHAYVQAAMLLFISISKYPQSAEVLNTSGLSQQLCLEYINLYSNNSSRNNTVTSNNSSRNNTVTSNGGKEKTGATERSWLHVYCLGVRVTAAMLHTLKYNFLKDALDFVGVHQDRMSQCLGNAGMLLEEPLIKEAVCTCQLLGQLAHYRREWRLQLPTVLHQLMTSMCLLLQRCVSVLIRPQLLQHMLEKQRRGEELGRLRQDQLVTAPLVRRLSQQSSTDDADSSSNAEVLKVQHSLLEIVSECVTALRQFSPDLCQILLDLSLDVSEFEPFIQIGFSTPSVDQVVLPTFGTLVSATNMCLHLLTKLERSLSPARSGTDIETPNINRPLVVYVMETVLQLMMTQAVRYLREPGLSSRDKQLLKRELGTELNSFVQGLQRHLRRGPTSPASSSTQLLSPKTALSRSLSSSSFYSGPATPEVAFMRLVDSFIQKVLR